MYLINLNGVAGKKCNANTNIIFQSSWPLLLKKNKDFNLGKSGLSLLFFLA